VDGRQEREQTFEVSMQKGYCGQGIEEKEESIVLLLTLKALKRNVFTITAYKHVIFMCQFCQSATNRYQSISVIYLLIVIENRYIPIDNHMNLHQRLVIDYRFHPLDTPEIQ